MLEDKPQHHPLSLLVRYDTPPRVFAKSETENAEMRLARGEKNHAAIVDQICAGRYHTLILSTECLFQEVMPERGRVLLDRLRKIGSTVEVICYLRNPVTFFLSSTGQKLKATHVLPPLAAPDYLTP